VTKRAWKIFIVLTISTAVILAVFNWRWMTGLLLGSMASTLAYRNTENYVDRTISAKMPAGTALHMMLNYTIWTVVLIVSAVLPNYLNVLSCAFGLFMIRISLIIDGLWRKEK
jgi:hypothetical protein